MDLQQLAQRISNLESKLTLGLSDHPPGQMRIYCNRQYPPALWYAFDGEPRPLSAACITGYLTKLEFSKETRRNKETSKLHIHIQGDRPYLLECGGTTAFAKSVIVAVASLSAQDLTKPIAIAPRPGDDDNVLFATVYSDFQWVNIPEEWRNWEAVDWREITLIALEKLAGARSVIQRN